MHFPATWCQVPWKVLEKSEAKIEIFQAPNSAIVCTCVYDNCKLSPPNLSASASKTVVFNHLFHFYLSKCWMSVLWNSIPNMPAADSILEQGWENRVLHWWVVLENAQRKGCGSGNSWWKLGLVPSSAAVTETGRGRFDIERLSITF